MKKPEYVKKLNKLLPRVIELCMLDNTNTLFHEFDNIMDKFDTKIKDPRRSATGRINTKIIKEFLKINCDISEASKELNNFFKKYSLNIVVSKDYFPIRSLKSKNIKIKFLSSNVTNSEFYSSLIFSIDIQSKKNYKNFISGGRYDELTNNLGLKKISAVGAAVNISL